jgi:hypothetical protein
MILPIFTLSDKAHDNLYLLAMQQYIFKLLKPNLFAIVCTLSIIIYEFITVSLYILIIIQYKYK